MSKQLAQLNIANAVALKGDPRMAGFFDNLETININAEAAKGFIWRLRDASADSTAEEAFPDPLVVVNMSVWKSLDALRQFTYKTTHVEFIRRRHQWFRRGEGPSLVLWWVEEGHQPTLAEGRSRLSLLAEHGPTAEAFTFGKPFKEDGSLVGAAGLKKLSRR